MRPSINLLHFITINTKIDDGDDDDDGHGDGESDSDVDDDDNHCDAILDFRFMGFRENPD